jgi:hypothetical protein
MKERSRLAAFAAIIVLVLMFGISCGGGGGGNSPAAGTTGTTGSTAMAALTGEAVGTLTSAGGTLEVTKVDSPIRGAKVVVPAGALADSDGFVTVAIGYQDNPAVEAPSAASIAGKTIILSKTTSYDFLQPVIVTIPYAEGTDPMSLTVLYWNDTNNMYEAAGIKSIDTTNRTVTFTTVHFSAYTPFGVAGVISQNIPAIDTGFRPATDGFFHPNFGSYDSPGGSSLGMVNYATWYFSVKKNLDGQGLYLKYRQGDANVYADDTNARELISRAQVGSSQIWGSIWSLVNNAIWDDYAGALLLVNMAVTKMPQTLVLRGFNAGGSTPIWSHAVLVYRYSAGKFYVYDSNFPGEEITLDWDFTNGFSNYSKANAYAGYATITYSFEAMMTTAAARDFENLYEGAETGWASSSRFTTVSVSSPAVDQNGTAIVSDANNVTVTGTVSGGVKTARYIVYTLNGYFQGVAPIDGGSYTITLPTLPNPSNSLMLVATDDPRNPFNAYAGFKEIAIRVQGQAFFINAGFETGDFTGWTHETHEWFNATPYPPASEKSGIVTPGADPYTGQLMIPMVYKGNYAARVNNYDSNYHISSFTQTAAVPQGLTHPELRFYWAAVLEDPRHPYDEQPYVDIRVVDEDNDGEVIYSRHFYSSDPSYSGWQNGTGLWRIIPWQTVIVDVSQHRGHRVTLRVEAADCAQGGHGGYVYLDGDE